VVHVARRAVLNTLSRFLIGVPDAPLSEIESARARERARESASECERESKSETESEKVRGRERERESETAKCLKSVYSVCVWCLYV